MGLDVRFGTSYREDADLCVLHHNLSRLEPRDLPVPPANIRVINGAAIDISKGRYSKLRLMKGDAWDGQVIIKTQANYYGLPEFQFLGQRDIIDTIDRVRQHFLGKSVPQGGWTYFVLRGRRDVPDWVWDSEHLIVERFMPERRGDMYCVRGWMFLGTKGYAYKIWSDKPLVKTSNMVGYEILPDVPEQLMTYRVQLGLDYGKFDYVNVEGQVHLIDANKTPSFAGDVNLPRFLRLAEGIMDYIR